MSKVPSELSCRRKGVPSQLFVFCVYLRTTSGLKGVDLGSFPVVSSWIKSSINAALSYYLSPHYISIDVLAWLNEDESVTYFDN